MTKSLDIKSILLDIGSLLFIYNILRFVFNKAVKNINESIFFGNDFLFFSAFSDFRFTLFFLIVSTFLLFFHKKLSWSSFENYKTLRLLVIIILFPIFWEQFFYDYNFYHDSDFLVDKILLLLFMVLVYIHPSFVFMFISLGMILFSLLGVPLAESSSSHWPEMRPIYDLTIMFISFLLLNIVRNVKTNIFLLLALSIHASNYFIPGVAKIEISPNGWEWTFLDNLDNLFVSSYLYGWLGFIHEDIIMSIAKIIDILDPALTIFNMILQLGAIFLLINKRVSITLFLLFEALHIGIFIVSGIFFWEWIIINVGFAYILHTLPKEDTAFLFDKKVNMIFMMLLILSPLMYRPFIFAWWDGAVNTVYDIYIETDDNKTIKLNKIDLSPYYEVFIQNHLSYINPDPTLVNNHGFLLRDLHPYSHSFLILINKLCQGCLQHEVSSFKNDSYLLYNALENASSVDEVSALLTKHGSFDFDKDKKEILESFLYDYFTNYNQRGVKKYDLYKKLGAPYTLYEHSAPRLESGTIIRKIEIFKTNTWYDKSRFVIERFNHKKLLEVKINVK